jgi:hypothetical protein
VLFGISPIIPSLPDLLATLATVYYVSFRNLCNTLGPTFELCDIFSLHLPQIGQRG